MQLSSEDGSVEEMLSDCCWQNREDIEDWMMDVLFDVVKLGCEHGDMDESRRRRLQTLGLRFLMLQTVLLQSMSYKTALQTKAKSLQL